MQDQTPDKGLVFKNYIIPKSGVFFISK